MRKIPFAGIELTSQRVRGLRDTSELPGRGCSVILILILISILILIQCLDAFIYIFKQFFAKDATCFMDYWWIFLFLVISEVSLTTTTTVNKADWTKNTS